MLGVGAYVLAENFSLDYNKQMIVSVDNGQKANLQLPDGTRVWLNSGSSIRYDKSYNRHGVVRLLVSPTVTGLYIRWSKI